MHMTLCFCLLLLYVRGSAASVQRHTIVFMFSVTHLILFLFSVTNLLYCFCSGHKRIILFLFGVTNIYCYTGSVQRHRLILLYCFRSASQTYIVILFLFGVTNLLLYCFRSASQTYIVILFPFSVTNLYCYTVSVQRHKRIVLCCCRRLVRTSVLAQYVVLL